MTVLRRRNLGIKVIPVWIFLLNESDFPCAIPSLKPLLSANSGLDIGMRFEIDKPMYVVVLRKSGHNVVTMFGLPPVRLTPA
jgi:hypothetical protein